MEAGFVLLQAFFTKKDASSLFPLLILPFLKTGYLLQTAALLMHSQD